MIGNFLGYLLLLLYWLFWIASPTSFALSVGPLGYIIGLSLLLLSTVFIILGIKRLGFIKVIGLFFLSSVLMLVTMDGAWDLTTELFFSQTFDDNRSVTDHVVFALISAVIYIVLGVMALHSSSKK